MAEQDCLSVVAQGFGKDTPESGSPKKYFTVDEG